MVSTMRMRRRPSWLRVTGVSLAIFLAVLALLWFRVSTGEDPVLGAQASSAQVTTTATPATTSSDNYSSSSTSSTSSSSSDIPTTSAS